MQKARVIDFCKTFRVTYDHILEGTCSQEMSHIWEEISPHLQTHRSCYRAEGSPGEL